MDRRGSGILLHVSSLPSPYGIGDFGPEAYKFADFLAQTKQSLWQILPLNPTCAMYGNSPYSSISAFAGNTLFLSPDLLVEEGFLSRTDLQPLPPFPTARCDFSAIIPCKERWLEQAYQQFKTAGKDRGSFEAFCSEHASWLEDFSLFVVIKKRLAGKPWDEWPKALRDRDPDSLQTVRSECRNELEKEKFWQYLFFRQWDSLKAYGNQKGIRLFGDLAIYVSFDSADVWANPQLFKLNDEKQSTFVSGVPPDYFSKTGQLWGNPVYRWDVLKETGFEWWIERLAHHLRLYDAVRIDHFRGLVAYWEVPSGEKTAIHGTWVNAPVEDFLKALVHRFPKLPVIAEDLGLITPDVREVMNRFKLPGMKVLLFAFEEDNPRHPYLPHNYDRSFLVYTGTHDNNTARGWFETEATPEDKKRLFRYLGSESAPEEIHWALIRLAMMSVANLAIISMQDLLGLGAEARMNTPSTTQGNWQWRLSPGQITPSLSQRLLEMTEIYGRQVDRLKDEG